MLFNLSGVNKNSDFNKNFSAISKNAQGKYIINEYKAENLPYFLENFNIKAWVDEWLSNNYIIYYPCTKYDVYEDYLNKVLLGKYKRLWDSEEKFNEYLKENKGKLQYIEIEGVHYFFKLTL